MGTMATKLGIIGDGSVGSVANVSSARDGERAARSSS